MLWTEVGQLRKDNDDLPVIASTYTCAVQKGIEKPPPYLKYITSCN